MYNRTEQVDAESGGEVLKTNCPEPLESVHIQPFTRHRGPREHRLDTVADRSASEPLATDYRAHTNAPGVSVEGRSIVAIAASWSRDGAPV